MTTSSSGISFSGLFSGLDTESIIEQLIEIERQPINLLEQKKTKLDFKKESLLEVNNSLLTLKGTLPTLAAGVTTKMTAASSDESILTASANAAAQSGTYSFTVNQLATNHIIGSDWQASGFAYGGGNDAIVITMPNLSGGSITFDVQSDLVTAMTADTGESLEQIAANINSLYSAAGDRFSDYGRAYVLTTEEDPDGAGPINAGDKILMIEGKDTGENYELDISGSHANVQALINMTHQNWQNAEIQVAGGVVMQFSSNQASPVPGLTLDLQDTGGPVTVNVGVDDDAIVDAVKEFIDKFNASTDLLAKYITEDTVSDPSTVEDLVAGVLRGDMDLISLKSDIRIRTTGYYWNEPAAKYKILADIGIESEPSSGNVVSDNIKLDEETLRVALSEDRDAVSDLLQKWSDDLENYVDSQTKVSMIKDYAGTVYARVLGIGDSMDAIDEDIEIWEERVNAEEERLRASYTQMEQMLAALQTQSTYITQQLENLTNSSS